MLSIFERITNKDLTIRRINVTASRVKTEEGEKNEQSLQLDLFTDYEDVLREQNRKREALQKERRIQKTVLEIKRKYGKNSILKGINFLEGATTRERNAQIGGHKA